MADITRLPARRRRHVDPFEISRNVFLVLLCAFMLYPLVLMLQMSLKDRGQVIYEFFLVHAPFHFDNYVRAFQKVAPLFMNSVIMALGSVAASVGVAAVAGYGFAKLQFPLKKLLFGILFAKMMLPGILNLIPSFVLALRLGILDTYWPVILFCAGTSQAFWVFVMRTFVAQQPHELFESMRIDGAGEFRILGSLAVPLLRPMLALMSINVVTFVWNDYIWPLVTITTQWKRPITVGLAYITQSFPGEYGMLTAGYVIASIPLLVLFLFSMRQFIEGITAGAVKL
jgi:ABC-type glycerol-3-phosphate transport system permease component